MQELRPNATLPPENILSTCDYAESIKTSFAFRRNVVRISGIEERCFLWDAKQKGTVRISGRNALPEVGKSALSKAFCGCAGLTGSLPLKRGTYGSSPGFHGRKLTNEDPESGEIRPRACSSRVRYSDISPRTLHFAHSRKCVDRICGRWLMGGGFSALKLV